MRRPPFSEYLCPVRRGPQLLIFGDPAIQVQRGLHVGVAQAAGHHPLRRPGQQQGRRMAVPEPVGRPPGRADAVLLQRRDLVADRPLAHRGEKRRPVQVHQQRGASRHRKPEFCGPARQASQVISEQPFQIAAHVDAAGPHHLHPGAVGVARARHDLDIGGSAPAHHEIADRHAQQLAKPHARLGQHGEDQPVAQVPRPVPGRVVPGRAAIHDRLDLGRQQHRRPARPTAAHPHQRARLAPCVQVREQPPRGHPGSAPAQQPPRDRDRVNGLLPLIERDQRGQPGMQRLRRRNLARCRQRMLHGPPIPQPRQEPRDRGNPRILPLPGLAALLQERPPLRERRGIAAHSVRRPQVPVRLQPLLHRPDRRI